MLKKVGLIVGSVIFIMLIQWSAILEPAYPIIRARSLILDAAEVPSGWANDPPCDTICLAKESVGYAEQSFGRMVIPGSIVQEVYAHRSSAEAHYRYWEYTRIEFRDRTAPEVTFVPNPQITFRSAYAQQQTVACGNNGLNACRALLRYHNYLIEVYLPVTSPPGNQGMTFTEVNAFLSALDSRVGRCLVAMPMNHC